MTRRPALLSADDPLVLRVRAPVAIAGAVIALLSCVASAAPVFPAHAARIDVAVTSAMAATVTETYVPDAPPLDARLELLEQPCSEVETVAIFSGGRQLTVEASRNPPWTTLRVAGFARNRDPIRVRYDVRLDGGAAVPIALPSAAMASIPEVRGADISLAVVVAPALAAATVILPRLARVEDGVWRAHLLAIPSVIRIRLPGERDGCGRTLAGTTGGLEWRFWIFVGTMGIWIPVYFWWFSRGDESA